MRAGTAVRTGEASPPIPAPRRAPKCRVALRRPQSLRATLLTCNDPRRSPARATGRRETAPRRAREKGT